ncbi:MAG: hypothetical protein EHM59_02825 [Betaproteobacteria bacterium]|nr:MAG: hypothetical protein EHM59_02825 [Betaproteobacteria bacterium]
MSRRRPPPPCRPIPRPGPRPGRRARRSLPSRAPRRHPSPRPLPPLARYRRCRHRDKRRRRLDSGRADLEAPRRTRRIAGVRSLRRPLR